MSIYLYVQQINENINKTVIDIEEQKIIASAEKKGEKIKLLFSEYDEKKLQKFVETKSYDNIIINPYFWNHNYCKLSMLNTKNKFETLDVPDTVMVDVNLFYSGNFIILLSFFNILAITYCQTKEQEFDNFLNRLNIDRNIFADFLIKNNFPLPLTENFMKLIKRVFRNDNILDFVFLPNLFTVKEISTILEEFDYGSLNSASEYIFNSHLSDGEKLCLCRDLIFDYDTVIDIVDTIYIDIKKFKPYLCYYLYTMDIPSELVNIYYFVWKIYIENKGATKLIIMGDDIMNDKIQQRYNAIKDNFNLK